MISRRRNRVRPAMFVVAGILLSAVGCAREQPAATPANITAVDLKKLSWIEGTWRGTGDGTAPFYERYRFQNGDTLVVEELADGGSGAVKRTTCYELKTGRFGSDRSAGEILGMLKRVPFSSPGEDFELLMFERGAARPTVVISPG
jgi:hypothetical protein